MIEPHVFRGKTPAGSKQAIQLKVINFVFKKLAAWRDDATRPAETAETRLNAQLTTYLVKMSRREDFPVIFQIEGPQSKHRRIDIVANPDEQLVARGYFRSIYDEIVVFEAKRLPAPGLGRQREYVTGGPTKLSGGIQRFKACVHGNKHNVAAMIGYIQSKTPRYFFSEINKWILELCTNQDDCVYWTQNEILGEYDEQLDGTARSLSVHSRKNNDPIALHHLWLVM